MNQERKKMCSRCEEWKNPAEFYRKRKDRPVGYQNCQSMCKPCYNATYTTDYRKILKGLPA